MTAKPDILRAAMDLLNVAVVVIDDKERIIMFNQTAGKLFGQDAHSRIDSSILRCHPERAEPGVLKMIGQMKTGELKKYEGWVNFRHNILYEYIYPLIDQSGKYIGAVAELHPATEKAEYVKNHGEWKEPELHGVGASSPRSPHPEKPGLTH
jgi:PAS domain S-box-containing protein